MDSDYQPPPIQTRDVFGITLEERRNEVRLDASVLQRVVTKNRDFSFAARRNALVALITLKYTQSNSVCVAADGQSIGVGAGQQSRIHCTRIACDKADSWRLRQHPAVANLPFKPGLSRPELDNAVDLYLRGDALSREQKREWLTDLDFAVLASDGYIPFRDSIDRAVQSGVRYIVQPGGSNRDQEVVKACDEYGMTMAMSGIRLFHH
jgi:phosphoribosylaminoimidazolecarboxamide formyltransferase/IMP cyclohydrolase